MSRFGIGEIIFIITFWEQIFVLMTPNSFFFRPQLGSSHRSRRSHVPWGTSVKRYAPQASTELFVRNYFHCHVLTSEQTLKCPKQGRTPRQFTH